MSLAKYISGTTQTKASRLIREYAYTVLSQYDLTPTYWSMLGIILEAKDGVRQVEIARALHVKAPLVTGMVHTLENRGLVQSVQNQFDARAKLLAVTPAGKKLLKAIETDLNKQLDSLLSGLTEADMATYRKVLQVIIENDSNLREEE